MIKQRLLTSVAAVALFAVPGNANTTIDSDTSTALTTGVLLSSGTGTANAGDITIDSGDSIKISKSKIGAITVDTSNYVNSNGTIKNSGESTAYGIHIDVSSSPNLSGASFTASSSTVTGTGIYLDSSSSLDLSGDGTGKYGLYFDSSSGDGTYTGNVTMNGGTMTVKGSGSYGLYMTSGTTFVGDLSMSGSSSITMTEGSSYAMYFGAGTVFTGDLTLGSSSTITMEDNSNTAIYMGASSTGSFTGNIALDGSIVMYQDDVRSTSSSSLQGVLLQTKITGNVTVGSSASISVIGAGAKAMTIEGYGVTGAVTIGGTISTLGYSSSYDSKYSSTNTVSTYPEAGTAFSIGATITGGVMVTGAAYSGASTSSGTISVSGTGYALSITPSNNSSVTQSEPLTIGVYKYDGDLDTYDPGFSFYNRGTISASPMNENNSAETIYMAGTEAYPTILTGGVYNSGSIKASATTNDDKASSITATAVYIGAYTYLDNPTWDGTTGTWGDAALATKDTGDQAAFVNSNVVGGGTISASTSGYKAGAATALAIAQNAKVPSLLNSGTITAIALTTDKDLTTTISSSNGYSEYAVAIYDGSGTLTSIYNTGTISAYAGVGSSTSSVTKLKSDKELAVAIDLSSGNILTPSGSGVTITERATSTSSATIIGNIYFGTGDNQVIDVQGTSSSYTASIIGDIVYGATGSKASPDTLQIGAYGIVEGKVTSGSGPGVNVNISSNGILYLENDTAALNAATVHVADSGTLSIGVSQSLTTSGTGSIDSKGTVILDKGSNLYLTYSSFLPQGSNTYTLITAPSGDIRIDSNTLSTTNTKLTKNVSDGGYLPYLFYSAKLAVTSISSGDALVLTVTPKTSDQLGLVGYAKQLFPYVNTALSSDDTLGSAMIYGIHNATEAQKAYSAFAPNVTGGDRAGAISITDSATGPVAARQRSLLMYAHEATGSTSVWANEFVQMIKDPGRGAESLEGTRELAGFKDNGFGMSVGVDSGSPKYGWYGAAITYYAGDVGELKRTSKTHEQWLLLSGYSVWRGTGLFFNSKIDAGYGKFDGSRSITLITSTSSSSVTTYTRTADNKREGALLSGSMSTGAYLNYGAATFSPTFNLDGMMVREGGYKEWNPGTATDGDAFDLKVQPYYARSLRAFLGVDVRYDVNMWDFFLQPEVRLGYRYDFYSDPQKLKVAFAYSDTSGATAQPGEQFTVTGPDPAKGSLVLGSSIAATTDSWTFGFHFDFLRGTNGMIQEVGTLSIVGKI